MTKSFFCLKTFKHNEKKQKVSARSFFQRSLLSISWKIIREIEQTTLEEEERVMAPLLQYSLDEAREEGIQKGMEKGMEEGIQKGMEKGMQAVALNMLKNKFKLSVISEITGLSEKEIKNLKISP